MDDVVREIGLAPSLTVPRAFSGRGVTVAVLDSGIDARHPFLAVRESVSTCPEPCGRPGRHGTHCAGAIASRSAERPGVAPDVRLLDVKVALADGMTSPGWLAQGIDEALDRGADVLSISFGLNRFPVTSYGGHGWVCVDGRCILCRAVDHATACGAVVVAAAGNGHLRAQALLDAGEELSAGTELLCPGQARSAVTVGAFEKEPVARLYPRSSRGPAGHGSPKPDLVAPGVDVTSTIPVPAGEVEPNPFDLFGLGSGTSVATAVVAGAVALLIERRRSAALPWSPAEIREELLGRCVRPLNACLDDLPGAVGAGVLDLSRLAGEKR
ncbi:MAG TPA: S8 family serine peptidase [Thermoanaerobaculia bacterium]|jgi:subtilisin family serine protease